MDLADEIRNDPEKGARLLESEYKAGLTTLARRLCADEGDAEELVNRTFAEVVRSIDTYLEQSAFFGWMCQILVNLRSKDLRRKSNRTVAVTEGVDELPDEDSPARLFRDVDASLLRDAVQSLPNDMREAVVMRYFLDLPLRRMAKILCVPEGTVNSRLHYARLALAAKLGARSPGVRVLVLGLLLAAGLAIGGALYTLGAAVFGSHAENAEVVSHAENAESAEIVSHAENAESAESVFHAENAESAEPTSSTVSTSSTSSTPSTPSTPDSSEMNAKPILAAASLALAAAPADAADALSGVSLPVSILVPEKVEVIGGVQTDTHAFIDGNLSTYYDVRAVTNFVFDLGAPRVLTGIRAAGRNNLDDNNSKERLQGFTLFGGDSPDACDSLVVSNRLVIPPKNAYAEWVFEDRDGVPHTTAWKNGAVEDEWDETDATVSRRAFRYYRLGIRLISNGSESYANFGEFRLVADGLAVDANRPRPWGDGTPALAGEDAASGIRFSGTLLAAAEEGGTADVWAYVSDRDCGDSLAAWQAGGTGYRLAEGLSAGETYSADVSELAEGVWFARVFAVAGDESMPSVRTERFAAGSVAATPPMHGFLNGNGAIKNVYDGSTGNFTDTHAPGSACVFDLSALADGRSVAALRYWHRETSNWIWNRARTARVFITADPVAWPAGTSAQATAGGRAVYVESGTDASLGAEWTEVENLGQTWFEYGRPAVDVAVPRRLAAKATALRIENVGYFNVREIEIRDVKYPAGTLILIR